MQFWTILGLWLLYLMLTSNLEPRNLAAGLLIAVGLTALLRPGAYPLQPRQLPGMVWALARYGFMVARDVIAGGLQVARLTLDPQLPIHPAVIAIPSGAETELATALSAHAITLSPGAMVIEIGEHGMMYTHTLDVNLPDEAYFVMQRQRRDLLAMILPQKS